jgi:sugar phosphate isomerase/epimerase
LIKTAITIALVPQARQGPFVFHGDLAGSVKKAAALGFDAVELFPPGPEALDARELRTLLGDHGLKLAAIGTGAGWVVHQLTLVETDAARNRRAHDFVHGLMDVAAELGAPVIVGSMQGRYEPDYRNQVLSRLAVRLQDLGQRARDLGVPLLYEPLNRYETNLFNRQSDAANWLRVFRIENVRLLCDLFHMNIEEANVAAALRRVRDLLGHVHFVDSNRLAPGMGHTDFAPIVAALREIGYDGYASAECFPQPDPDAAAQQTINMYRRLFHS